MVTVGHMKESSSTRTPFIRWRPGTGMTDVLRLVTGGDAEDRRRRVLPQLPKCDVDVVWAEISSYIQRLMILHKGVHLSGLGTFTFSQQKCNVNVGNKSTKIHHPIFILAGKLVRSLGLKQTRQPAAAARLPVVQLNFAAVSQQTPFSRDAVESCVRETLDVLYEALASEKSVFLVFKGIGVLWFKNNKVQMKFSMDFINAVSGTNAGCNSITGSSISLLSGALSKLQRPQAASAVTLPAVSSSQPDNKDRGGLLPNPNQRSTGEVPQQRESNSNQTLQMKAVAPETVELNPTPPMEATNNLQSGSALRPTISTSSDEASPKPDQHPVNASCSRNTGSGPELCCLCTQKALRNVPVYRRGEQQSEENAQEKLLLLREQQRDQQDVKQELAKLAERREHAKQVAAFNLQLSEKKEKTPCPDYCSSYIFRTRPLTPPRRIQQLRYLNELQSQVELQRQHEAHDQQNQFLMEHLDQIQLIQALASQRAQQFQQKQEKTKHYKKDLDMQVKDKKCMETPEYHPENSRLNRCETAVSNAESRERAQKLFQINLSAATQKKKEELQNHHIQLEKEREMLKQNKTNLILDRIHHFETKRNIRKSLEDEWSHSVKLKLQREDEERIFLRSAGELLVDKIEEYRRCSQCKRRTTNCGGTNIWKDSRFLSGSQFMI